MKIFLGLRPLMIAGALELAAVQYGGPANAAGPEITGHMQNFTLAPAARSRAAIQWKNSEGKAVGLRDFKGKIVLLNFWATWCAPCIRELPSLDRLQAALGGDDFHVVALNINREGRHKAARMVRRLNLKNLALNLDREVKVAKTLGVLNIPTTFLFDHNGIEIGKLEGAAEWDEKEAVRLVKYFIDNPDHADTLPPYKRKVSGGRPATAVAPLVPLSRHHSRRDLIRDLTLCTPASGVFFPRGARSYRREFGI